MTSKKPEYPRSIGRLLSFASADCDKFANQRLKEYGLTLRQWILLMVLWGTNQLSESELAKHCRMSASSLNRLLDRMEAKRLVVRFSDPKDRRKVFVKLSKQGRALSYLQDFSSGVNEALLADLSSEEQEQFYFLLEKVAENLRKALL